MVLLPRARLRPAHRLEPLATTGATRIADTQQRHAGAVALATSDFLAHAQKKRIGGKAPKSRRFGRGRNAVSFERLGTCDFTHFDRGSELLALGDNCECDPRMTVAFATAGGQWQLALLKCQPGPTGRILPVLGFGKRLPGGNSNCQRAKSGGSPDA